MWSQTDPADHSTLLIRMTFHSISFHGLTLKDKPILTHSARLCGTLWPTSPSALCFDPFLSLSAAQTKSLCPAQLMFIHWDHQYALEFLPILLWYSFHFHKRLDTITSIGKGAVWTLNSWLFGLQTFLNIISTDDGTHHLTLTTLASNKNSETDVKCP